MARSCSSRLCSLMGRLRSLAAYGQAEPVGPEGQGGVEAGSVGGLGGHGGMGEPHLLQVASSLRQQGHDAPGQADAVLGGLRPPGSSARAGPGTRSRAWPRRSPVVMVKAMAAL